MNDAQLRLKRPSDFEADLAAIERSIRNAVEKLDKAGLEHRLRTHQAEWHVRGITYHCRNLITHYQDVAEEIAMRATLTKADVLIMYAPAIQKMWFEFYALVNLCRIALDNLRSLLQPVFATAIGQLPKSISGFLEGQSDCPVYIWLRQQSTTTYLSDMRNCLVHYRSFATGDNALITKDAIEIPEIMAKPEFAGLFTPMAKGLFRMVGDTGISANFYVPDVIFNRENNNEKLVAFTYEMRRNVLSQSMRFVELVSEATLQSYTLLHDPGKAVYQYSKSKRS